MISIPGKPSFRRKASIAMLTLTVGVLFSVVVFGEKPPPGDAASPKDEAPPASSAKSVPVPVKPEAPGTADRPAPAARPAVPSPPPKPELEITWRDEPYLVFFADLTRLELELVWKDVHGNQLGSLGNAAAFVEAESGRPAVFATNAGMFRPDHSPVGLHVADGETHVPLDTGRDQHGNFYLLPNGVFFVRADGTAGVLETEGFRESFPPSTYAGTLRLATQSGPMLVIDGAIHPAFREGSTSKYVRSGVGVLGERTVIFAMSERPVNLHTFASFFRDLLHCDNALYLDGAISEMHAPGHGVDRRGGAFGGILVAREAGENQSSAPGN